MVEIAAVTDVGKMFCETTYVLEGNDPLGCWSWIAFKKINRHIKEGVKLSKVTLNVCNKAGKMSNQLLVELQSKSSSKVAETEKTIDRLQNSINQIKQWIEANEIIASLRGGGVAESIMLL